MAVTQSQIQKICNKVTRDVAQAYEGLTLYFIIHSTGRLQESIAVAEHEIEAHPARKSALTILNKTGRGERSKFLGLAISREKTFLGFHKKDHLLGLISLNVDHYKNENEIIVQIYHLVWHVLDLYDIRKNPKYINKFKTGTIIPKRTDLNLSKANMQADIFAGLMTVLDDDKDNKEAPIVRLLAEKRGIMSLSPVYDYKAEDYPSVIAVESCEFMVKELLKAPPAQKDLLTAIKQVAIDVSNAFHAQNIQQWWDFSIPAQDMAWRGFKKEEILTAAAHTSNSPYVRSIAYLIHEVTDLDISKIAGIENSYNAFIDPEITSKLHRDMIDSVFEEALSEGGEEGAGRALREAANRQNEELTEGRILGWCANALQDAARAIDNAFGTGVSPTQAARMQFEGSRHIPSWDDLKELGHRIVDDRRKGMAVTLGHVAEICYNSPTFGPMLESLKITMNDPSYIQKLEAANDLALMPRAPTLEPHSPAPQGPKVQGPVLSVPLPAPTLGGGSHNAHIAKYNQELANKKKSDTEQTDTTNS